MKGVVEREGVVLPLGPRGAKPRRRPWPEEYHKPVLLKEVLGFLQVAPGKRYIDATLGLGGHAAAIAGRGGLVLGIDVDKQSLKVAQDKIAAELGSKNYEVRLGNFGAIGKIARENGFAEVDGVLFDLGMSSWQLEYSGRGFSFQKDEPLDMRMDPSLGVTAADLVNGLYEEELSQLFRKFGEDPWFKRYAHALVEQRRRGPITTTKQLADLIVAASGGPSAPSRAGPRGEWHRHPATRIFQALRLAVNDELGNLKKALPQALELIKPGGRLVVISFHSLEDRIVKRCLADLCRLGSRFAPIRILTPKPVRPSEIEIKDNPRARSAKLRAAEKVIS